MRLKPNAVTQHCISFWCFFVNWFNDDVTTQQQQAAD